MFPWRGFDSSGINLGTVALWLLQIMVSKHTPTMAFLRAWTCFHQMEELKMCQLKHVSFTNMHGQGAYGKMGC